MNRRRVVRVPASSANLGPGYDAFAAALVVHLELEVEETGAFALETDVRGVPLDRSNLCVRAFELLHPADGVTFRLRSDIPVAAGLGSSAAAIVAGLVAADHMYELDADLLPLAVGLEGHPDNVAAALYGGFVICADGRAERFDPPAELEGVLAIPPHEVPTAEARAALPAEVPIEDAVHNIAHAALLVLGLARGDSRPGGARSLRPHPPAAPRARSTRARWSCCAGPASSARWAPRSRAPVRPCCSGRTTSRPAGSTTSCTARRPTAR